MRKKRTIFRLAGSATLFLFLSYTRADGNTDPNSRYGWSENTGWVNAAPANSQMRVHFDGSTGWLSGYVWSENIGWIKLGSTPGGPYINTAGGNWGVNMSASGNLSGYAWGENIGWINFSHAACDASVSPVDGKFTGHAWGENIGWLKLSGLSPDCGMRTLAFDRQPQGTPNWWLDHHHVMENDDEGDGIPAWKEYVADTDPGDDASWLRITAISTSPTVTDIVFEPASNRRYYTLIRTDHLRSHAWIPVAGQTGVAGTGAEQALQDTNAVSRAFYSVNVSIVP